MRRLCYLISLISLISLQANAQFRGMEWSSSKKDLISKYGNPEFENEAWVVYKYTLAGKSVSSVFRYKQDRLYQGAYLLDEKHTNRNDYINDYDKFKGLLTKKYGEPKEDETYWKKDLYKDDYSDWGMAVAVGHLIKYSSWSDEKTDIECSIQGDNYKIEVTIVYKSIELKEWVEKEDEEIQLDDF
jgi:hypothetical protein|tara:strand:+ start:248 stop:805 length:558 start_codon:yes stop_codon:yes gene_type:complete